MNYRTILVFLVIVVGGGLLIGSISAPDEWYRALEKPAFNPQPWVFAPVWTVLYIMIAVAGARVWSADMSSPFRYWTAQLVLNFLWTPVFFALHRPDIALAVIGFLFLAIVGFIAASWSRDRTAAVLFLPYGAWVAFAALLNFAIWRMNG